MNAKHLIALLTLTLTAGATFAAFRHGAVEAPRAAAVADCAEPAAAAIPRVVVTAHRDQARSVEAPVARVVVTGRRIQSGPAVAAASR
ncbi:MAG: hypothetical protein EPN19_09850 [Betaproteobacteria bacterium]|nr:MAG: hypothetical protein EPO29_08180 [Betaproteobacteria bacterium]TAN53161.1 MAG: hypothetical protein EPN19_09850 [Betaproteobacteria bacterium]